MAYRRCAWYHAAGGWLYSAITGRGIINEREEVIYDFEGRPIRLPWERWLHTTRPEHPYMLYMRSELVETLQNPDFVSRSSTDPASVRIYIKWFENTYVGNKWLRAIVKAEDDIDSFVLTAFVRPRADAGDVIWQKENP